MSSKFNYYLVILIKKLLTLLGSVAVIGSTAAVAIACEGKPLSVVISKGEKNSWS
ncbi:lipoprotein [Mycoplasma mycoides]|uniref:lipoprotein n=1 Tax=Mycoplasma mycoides TaxID=2102 RepID=UPI00223F1EF1|nr:lipoprotein [Mycoplasma mycoides]